MSPSVAPFVVFTDGALEDGLGTCGGVVFEPGAAGPWLFCFEVPEALMHEWRQSVQRTASFRLKCVRSLQC